MNRTTEENQISNKLSRFTAPQATSSFDKTRAWERLEMQLNKEQQKTIARLYLRATAVLIPVIVTTVFLLYKAEVPPVEAFALLQHRVAPAAIVAKQSAKVQKPAIAASNVARRWVAVSVMPDTQKTFGGNERNADSLLLAVPKLDAVPNNTPSKDTVAAVPAQTQANAPLVIDFDALPVVHINDFESSEAERAHIRQIPETAITFLPIPFRHPESRYFSVAPHIEAENQSTINFLMFKINTQN
jgi:hypothetical protein